MTINSCLLCRFHEIKQEEKEPISHCQKENCWSQFSKCIMKKALNRFLEQESPGYSPTPETPRPGLV